MYKSLIVARKELNGIIKTRNMFIGLFFAIWFSVMTAPVVKTTGSAPIYAQFDNLLFYMVLMLGMFMAYLFTGLVFFNEKREGVIETLLCTPLSLRDLWLGKVVGITIPAYLIALLTAGLITVIGNIGSPIPVLPSPPVVFHIIFVVPAFIAVTAGLLGFAQLLLGMRENRILNLVIFFLVFFPLFFARNAIRGYTLSWFVIGGLMALALILLAFIRYLTRYLSKERIVTSIV